MPRAYIAVGSNLGPREKNLSQAKKDLSEVPGIKFLRESKIYETDPVGGPPQGKYLNGVWEIETDLEPEDLLKSLLQIEMRMGRIRTERNTPRPIDLDILFYGDRILQTSQLIIPHARLHERTFVLKPLSDLAPDFRHPVLKKTIRELLYENHQRT